MANFPRAHRDAGSVKKRLKSGTFRLILVSFCRILSNFYKFYTIFHRFSAITCVPVRAFGLFFLAWFTQSLQPNPYLKPPNPLPKPDFGQGASSLSPDLEQFPNQRTTDSIFNFSNCSGSGSAPTPGVSWSVISDGPDRTTSGSHRSFS